MHGYVYNSKHTHLLFEEVNSLKERVLCYAKRPAGLEEVGHVLHLLEGHLGVIDLLD
jgi:hypothetical protein